MLISLVEIANTTHLIGSLLGKEVYKRLHKLIEDNPQELFFEISAANVEVTDGTFARESLLQLVSDYRGRKGIMLVDITDRDQLDNWNYAAESVGRPLIAWSGKAHEILGDQTTRALEGILKLVFRHRAVTTPQIANALNISVPNASTQMNGLQSRGYLIRTQRDAASGGREYVYYAISPNNQKVLR